MGYFVIIKPCLLSCHSHVLRSRMVKFKTFKWFTTLMEIRLKCTTKILQYYSEKSHYVVQNWKSLINISEALRLGRHPVSSHNDLHVRTINNYWFVNCFPLMLNRKEKESERSIWIYTKLIGSRKNMRQKADEDFFLY